MQTSAEFIRQGMMALKRDDKDEAFTLFSQALQQDPQSEQAWLWMSGAVRTPAEQRYCLERVLEINPDHAIARRGMAKLPVGPAVNPLVTGASAPAESTPVPPAAAASAPPPASEPAQEQPIPAETASTSPQRVVAPPPTATVPQPVWKWGRETYRYKPGQPVASYHIVERAGRDAERELYLVHEGDPNWLLWMLVATTPLEPLSIPTAQRQFTDQGLHYLVIPLVTTPVSMILKMLPAARFKFIGIRWVRLARHFGYLHENGQVYQQKRDFNLEAIHFDAAGNVAPVSYHRPTDHTLTFTAPERTQGSVTPASDVYVLGTSLLTLLGEATPPQVFAQQNPVVGPALKQHAGLARVLQRATDPDPVRRYKNGYAFADALARLLRDVLPKRGREQPGDEKPRSSRLVIWAVVVAILVFLLIGVRQLTKDTETAWVLPFGLSARRDEAVDQRLQFTSLSAYVNDQERMALDASMRRGGMPLPLQERIIFDVRYNGTIVDNPVIENLEAGRYQLALGTEPHAGTYEVLARVDAEEVARKVYFDPTQTEDIDLNRLERGGIQVDTSNYPEVNVYFGVVGEDGQAVLFGGNLSVEVLQDNQPVELFVMAPVDSVAEPLTVALALDVSGSMYGEPLVAAKQAAVAFVRQLGAGDTVCLYTFATQVQQLGTCTTDHQATTDAINGLVTIDDTAIYDAVVRVSTDLAQIPGRKAIVLLSDGADTRSTASLEVALEAAQQSNIPIYSIGLISEQFDGQLLERIAGETQGIYQLTPNPEAIQELYNQIQRQLTNQYRVTFQSIFPQRHEGTVTVRIKREEQFLEITRTFQVTRNT